MATFTNRDLRDLLNRIQPEVPLLGGAWLVRFMMTTRRDQLREVCCDAGFVMSPMG